MVFVTFWWNFKLFWMSTPRSFVVGSCWSGILLNDRSISGCDSG